jgi:hypothetical protein
MVRLALTSELPVQVENLCHILPRSRSALRRGRTTSAHASRAAESHLAPSPRILPHIAQTLITGGTPSRLQQQADPKPHPSRTLEQSVTLAGGARSSPPRTHHHVRRWRLRVRAAVMPAVHGGFGRHGQELPSVSVRLPDLRLVLASTYVPRVRPARSPTATADERTHSSADGCEVLMGGCGAPLVATWPQRALTQGSRLGFFGSLRIVGGRCTARAAAGHMNVGTLCGNVLRPRRE